MPPPPLISIFKKLVRKREVLISKVSIYIVIIIVLCHSVRLIPTIWEISQTFLEADEVRLNLDQTKLRRFGSSEAN